MDRPLRLDTPLAVEPHANPVCFRAVIDEALLEPGVLQSLLGCDPLLGVVDENAL